MNIGRTNGEGWNNPAVVGIGNPELVGKGLENNENVDISELLNGKGWDNPAVVGIGNPEFFNKD